jgi:flagellin
VKVSTERANLGAFQNRLEMAIKGIDNAAENLQAAESRIRDADMAKEMINYVRSEILSTSSASMLAQANITPQLILRILR